MIKTMNFGTKLCAFASCSIILSMYSNDLSELDKRIVKTYAKAYIKEHGLNQPLSRLYDIMSMHDLDIEAKPFNKKLLVLETTIWGTESEFSQPEHYLLEPEIASLKGNLLFNIIKRYAQLPDTVSSIILSKHTKSGLPAYYGESGRGSITCVTFVPKETMVAAMKEVSRKGLQAQQEGAVSESGSKS
jgi:hypothetical protein